MMVDVCIRFLPFAIERAFIIRPRYGIDGGVAEIVIQDAVSFYVMFRRDDFPYVGDFAENS